MEVHENKIKKKNLCVCQISKTALYLLFIQILPNLKVQRKPPLSSEAFFDDFCCCVLSSLTLPVQRDPDGYVCIQGPEAEYLETKLPISCVALG